MTTHPLALFILFAQTVSLATVCVVAVGFLAWYLQSALQMLLVAALLAVLLDPLVNLLSSPISPSFPRRAAFSL
jgi:predicted PurR-regulated permease PerM